MSGDENQKVLQQWADTVDQWGGRQSTASNKDVLGQLQRGHLGTTEFLPTSQVDPVFPKIVPLAEVKLDRPITMDVVFSYRNHNAAPMPTGVPTADLGVDQGDGFVLVTWGTEGAPPQQVKVDGNRGWRFPFVASYLRVDYIPIDEGVVPEWHLPGGQLRDLGVSAIILPASGAPCKPLTKTAFFRSMDAITVGSAAQPIPDYAVTFRLSAFGGLPIDMIFVMGMADPLFGVMRIDANSIAGEWPDYVIRSTVFPIEQNATFFSWRVVADAILRPTAVCELAL